MDAITFSLRAFTSIVCLALMLSTHLAISQKTDSTKYFRHIGGAVTVTNNGISLLPTFSLGKPAVMFDLNVGSKKLSFEPQFRFSLEGKPWSFIFWWRYKLLKKDKFYFNIGAHPAIAFRPVTMETNGVTKDVLVSQRYLAAELSPNFMVAKNISVGVYYLHSHGFEEAATRNTDFITINSNFSNIRLTEKFFVKFNPQLYYLKMDDHHGYYGTATIALARKNFPLSVQSILNLAFKTDIPAKNDFVWNVSLIYSFRKEYAPR